MVPTELKILRGNPGKRPIRPEPRPRLYDGDPPDPPDFLLPWARVEWKRIVDELVRLNLLTMLDVQLLAAYCQSYARWRQAEEFLVHAQAQAFGGLLVKGRGGDPVYNPLCRAAAYAARDMVDYAHEFGLSPTARARIAAGIFDSGPSSQSKFGNLFAV